MPHPKLNNIMTSTRLVLLLFVRVHVHSSADLACDPMLCPIHAYLQAMGRTQTVLYLGLVGSWVGQVRWVVICDLQRPLSPPLPAISALGVDGGRWCVEWFAPVT